MDTTELGGGSYPAPCEVIDCDDEDDYDEWYADYYYEEFKLGGIE